MSLKIEFAKNKTKIIKNAKFYLMIFQVDTKYFKPITKIKIIHKLNATTIVN